MNKNKPVTKKSSSNLIRRPTVKSSTTKKQDKTMRTREQLIENIY